MMPDRQSENDWKVVRELFEECLELDRAARARRLGDAAPAIRTEVEELLSEHEGSADRMNPGSCHRAFVSAAQQVVGIGSVISGYRILEVLGRGGMGTVYLAEQETPRRRVALKLVTSAVLGRESAQRFQLEADLLGRLRHRGIAQIYEVGVHEESSSLGVMQWPFFAMEFVEGAKTLSDWAAERAWTERQKLEILLQVCAAMQHAHERGVVHRDLKPQNVLIDAEGNAKVIDFGIARTLDQDSDLTKAGELVGTLRYMAPEQLRADSLSIDTRTDVHALGVLLYELLVGRLPFDFGGQSLPEVSSAICDQEARLLRQDLPGASSDLELILATAMAKEPARRYAGAGSVAEDLQRYLLCEPILARPPTLRYQLSMFARRRRGLVAAVTALILVSTIGGATSVWYAVRAQRAEQLATQQGEQKVSAMRRVFDNAMRSVIGLPRRFAGLPGATQLRREVVEEAVQQLQFVEASVPLDAAMQYSLAVAYRNLGGIQGSAMLANEGDRSQAMVSLMRAKSYLDELLLLEPDNVDALWLSFDVEADCGELAFVKDRLSPTAARHWQAVGALLDRLRAIIPKGDLRLLDAEAVHVIHQADAALMQQDHEAAVALYLRARDLRVAARGDRAPDDDSQTKLGSLYRSVAITEAGRGNYQAAFAAYEQSIEALSRVEQSPKNRPTQGLHAMVRSQFGYTLASQGQYRRGEQHLRWAQVELERLLAIDPSNAGFASSVGMASQRLADHLAITAKYTEQADDARRLYEEARGLAKRGIELGKPSLARGRDMVNVFLVAECERILAACEAALR
tara:strand:+ start:4433 stop:6835 length:2403 start_codon:yes stop_codon:yes gene_type:complete